MTTAVIGLAINLLVPLLKWFLGKQAKKTLSNEEFLTAVKDFQHNRSNAGQSALDWKDSLAKLKATIAKKKNNDIKKD